MQDFVPRHFVAETNGRQTIRRGTFVHAPPSLENMLKRQTKPGWSKGLR